MRNTGDFIRATQTAQNPPLQKFPGERRRTICFLAECAPDREKIVASDDHRQIVDPADVHGIRVIANVDDRGVLAQRGVQLSWK